MDGIGFNIPNRVMTEIIKGMFDLAVRRRAMSLGWKLISAQLIAINQFIRNIEDDPDDPQHLIAGHPFLEGHPFIHAESLAQDTSHIIYLQPILSNALLFYRQVFRFMCADAEHVGINCVIELGDDRITENGIAFPTAINSEAYALYQELIKPNARLRRRYRDIFNTNNLPLNERFSLVPTSIRNAMRDLRHLRAGFDRLQVDQRELARERQIVPLILSLLTHQDVTSESECSICHELIIPGNGTGEVTPCGHTFHAECLIRWFRARFNAGLVPNCPFCRYNYVEI